MKKRFLIILPVLMAMVLVFTQCNDNKKDECEDVDCREIFISVFLTLEYPDGQPVLLDSTKVFWVGQNRYLEQDLFWWTSSRGFGIYVIVDDSMREKLFNREEIMRFTAYLNGKIVHQRDVLVGADCCHVRHLGTESLVQVIPRAD